MSSSGVTVVLGGQWGDEGKGKLVDLLSVDADYVCRCQVSECVGWLYQHSGTMKNSYRVEITQVTR